MTTPTLYLPEQAVINGRIVDSPAFLVSVQGNIVAVGEPNSLRRDYPAATAYDLSGQILLPGGINGHNHAFQILMRGMGEDWDFMTWRRRVLYPVSQRLTRQDIYESARLAYWDMVRHGITAVADFFYLNDQGAENGLAIARAARDVGIRLLLARTFYDWEGAPLRYRETPEAAHDNTMALAARLAQEGLSEYVTLHVAPHSPHGASQRMVEASVATAQELDTYLHIHVAEGKYERQTMLSRHQMTPIQWCHRHGALGPKSLAIHAVWVDDEDLDILAETHTSVVHNPGSNMILGDGIAPVVAMLEKHIPVLLGTDGGCTNDRQSIFDEMRQTALLQKVHETDSSVIDAQTVFQMGTAVGSQALGLFGGKLMPQEAFDAVTLRLDDPSLLPGPVTMGHLVYALSDAAIDAVFVQGRRILHQGRPTQFDPNPLIHWARHWQQHHHPFRP